LTSFQVCGVENCAPINPGGSHYYPNTLKDHCNWAFNTYYLANRLGGGSGACNFGGSAILVCRGREKKEGRREKKEGEGGQEGEGRCNWAWVVEVVLATLLDLLF
jgi:hypothetical protein